jgi:hypothetical protein
MTTTTEIASNRPVVCPLARDADGNIVELPPNASAWRVRRQTGGRPRVVLGVDKQPMMVPLGYTVVDLEDILAPGAYRLDVVDGKGESLGVLTIDVAIGQLRNADESDAPADEAQPMTMVSLPSTGSEVRLVLEANVRSTQMAFVHNQKTLELGMRMAETLRDSVRAMADSQADWIKSMASARGFFRNAPLPQLPPPPTEEKTDDDDEDDESDDLPPPAPSWVEAVTPIVTVVTQQIIQAVMGFAQKPKNDETKFEIGDAFDWRRAAAKAEAAKLAPPPPFDLQAFMKTLPPPVLAKLLAVNDKLTAGERQKAFQLISLLEPAMRNELVARVETMSADDAATYLRAQIATPAA